MSGLSGFFWPHCFVSTPFTLMGWMHNLSLLALSILCWLPPSLPLLQSVYAGRRQNLDQG